MNWNDTLHQYATIAAPYIVPPLALMLATVIFKFVLSNKKTRQYAKLLMNVMQGKLESSLGAEKSKQVLELWNTIVKETENTANKDKTYRESYFVRRLKNAVDLSAEDEEHVKTILQWMQGQNNDINAASMNEDEYKLPKIPCVCEL